MLPSSNHLLSVSFRAQNMLVVQLIHIRHCSFALRTNKSVKLEIFFLFHKFLVLFSRIQGSWRKVGIGNLVNVHFKNLVNHDYHLEFFRRNYLHFQTLGSKIRSYSSRKKNVTILEFS